MNTKVRGLPDQIGFITKIYGDFRKGPFCKIFPNEYFAYWRVTVEQPLKDASGKIEADKNGNPKPDTNLRDYENIPFLREQNGKLVKQTIEEYFEREVGPHISGAWIDDTKTKVGTQNFASLLYFYEFKPIRSLEEIRRDIVALEQETEGMIKTILD